MKNILSIEREIEHFQVEIMKKKYKTLDELFHEDNKEWPHLLEALEHTNEIVGYQLIKNSRNYLVPKPIFIEGYKTINFFSEYLGTKIHSEIFRHRSIVDLNFLTKIYGLHAELKMSEDTDAIMSKALALTKEMLKKEGKVILISGPISSGGAGNHVENLRIFNKAIIGVSKITGEKVFNQMYFENLFSLVHEILVKNGGDQSSDYFIDNYYEELMIEDLFSAMYQIPRWQTSKGALREDYIASEIGLQKRQIDFEIVLPSKLMAPVMAF